MRLYLKNYDRYAETIVYDYPAGAYECMASADVQLAGARQNFGWFVREGDRVLGICASPEGPVLFLNNWCFVAEQGSTEAFVQDQVFYLRHGLRGERVPYAQRFGVGANPYDTEEEDVDLYRLIASLFRSGLVFKAYKRDWC